MDPLRQLLWTVVSRLKRRQKTSVTNDDVVREDAHFQVMNSRSVARESLTGQVLPVLIRFKLVDMLSSPIKLIHSAH